jgi:hypothetical protein
MHLRNVDCVTTQKCHFNLLPPEIRDSRLLRRRTLSYTRNSYKIVFGEVGIITRVELRVVLYPMPSVTHFPP